MSELDQSHQDRVESEATAGTSGPAGGAGSSEQIRLLAQALRCMEECVSITDGADRILFVNPAFLRTYGYEEHELIGQSIDIVRGDARLEGGVEQIFKATLAGGWRGRLWNRKRNGAEFPIFLSTSVVRDESGEPLALIGLARDLTERQRAEEQLRLKTAVLEAQLEATIDGILVVDESEKVILSNRQFARMWQTGDDLLDRSDDRLLLQHAASQVDGYEAFLERVQYLYRHREEKSRDEIRFKDGRVFDRYSTPLIESTGRYCGRIWYFRDITARKQAEELLRESERKYRNLYESMTDAFAQLDLQGRVQEFNQAFQRMLGYSREELLGLRCHDLTPAKWRALETKIVDEQVVARGYSEVYEKEFQKKDGTTFPVELRMILMRDEAGRPEGMWAIVRDISERKAMEWELHQAQRLESVGQLAAGIAHEINTPIQYVGDNLRFIEDAFKTRQAVLTQYEELRQAAAAGSVPPVLLEQLAQTLSDADWDYLSGEVPRAVAQSLDGVERVATIVRAMKEFAHPGRKEKSAADLNRALGNALIVARNEIKYVADVETDYGELPPVMCLIAEINQVFLNLLINAAHAIREVMKESEKKGKIHVRTRQVEDRAEISISDTGCGIPDAIRAKIFDPFFTTKGVGRGSGQGLTIARSIVVEKHGGALTFEPNVPQGTTFVISLPLDAPTTAGAPDSSDAR